MDRDGLRVLFERKVGRCCTSEELNFFNSLSVGDAAKIWAMPDDLRESWIKSTVSQRCSVVSNGGCIPNDPPLSTTLNDEVEVEAEEEEQEDWPFSDGLSRRTLHAHYQDFGEYEEEKFANDVEMAAEGSSDSESIVSANGNESDEPMEGTEEYARARERFELRVQQGKRLRSRRFLQQQKQGPVLKEFVEASPMRPPIDTSPKLTPAPLCSPLKLNGVTSKDQQPRPKARKVRKFPEQKIWFTAEELGLKHQEWYVRFKEDSSRALKDLFNRSPGKTEQNQPDGGHDNNGLLKSLSLKSLPSNLSSSSSSPLRGSSALSPHSTPITLAEYQHSLKMQSIDPPHQKAQTVQNPSTNCRPEASTGVKSECADNDDVEEKMFPIALPTCRDLLSVPTEELIERVSDSDIRKLGVPQFFLGLTKGMAGCGADRKVYDLQFPNLTDPSSPNNGPSPVGPVSQPFLPTEAQRSIMLSMLTLRRSSVGRRSLLGFSRVSSLLHTLRLTYRALTCRPESNPGIRAATFVGIVAAYQVFSFVSDVVSACFGNIFSMLSLCYAAGRLVVDAVKRIAYPRKDRSNCLTKLRKAWKAHDWEAVGYILGKMINWMDPCLMNKYKGGLQQYNQDIGQRRTTINYQYLVDWVKMMVKGYGRLLLMPARMLRELWREVSKFVCSEFWAVTRRRLPPTSYPTVLRAFANNPNMILIAQQMESNRRLTDPPIRDDEGLPEENDELIPSPVDDAPGLHKEEAGGGSASLNVNIVDSCDGVERLCTFPYLP